MDDDNEHMYIASKGEFLEEVVPLDAEEGSDCDEHSDSSSSSNWEPLEDDIKEGSEDQSEEEESGDDSNEANEISEDDTSESDSEAPSSVFWESVSLKPHWKGKQLTDLTMRPYINTMITKPLIFKIVFFLLSRNQS